MMIGHCEHAPPHIMDCPYMSQEVILIYNLLIFYFFFDNSDFFTLNIQSEYSNRNFYRGPGLILYLAHYRHEGSLSCCELAAG